MNHLSHLWIAAHLDEMRANAAQERLAAAASTKSADGFKSRFNAAAKSAWSLLSGPAERPLTPTPTLVNYPFRG